MRRHPLAPFTALDIMYGPAARQGTRIRLEVGSARLRAALRGQVMNKFSKYVGQDVHQETVVRLVIDHDQRVIGRRKQ